MARDTRARIAAAARAMLTEEGTDAVSMRRVAEAVGVTPMAIYRHYPNREALLQAVADECSAELGANWDQRAEVVDLEDRFRALLNDFLDFALGTPHLYTFLMTERRDRVRRFPEDFRTGESPTFTPVLRVVEQGMRDGYLREDDPVEVTLVITGCAQGLVELYLGGRIGLSEADFRALAERSVWRILDGVRK